MLAWPLIPLVGLVAAFNLVFLFNIALSGYAAWLLTREMTGRDAESLIAGAVFALSPVLIARGVGHFSLVAAAPLPIFALLLRRLGATGQLRYGFALGAVVAWATFSDAYYGVFCLLMAGINLLVQFVSVERAVDVPVVRIVGLRRTLNLLLVAVSSFVFAIALRGGGTVDLLGIQVRAHTLYTPMLVAHGAAAGAPGAGLSASLRAAPRRRAWARRPRRRRRGRGDDAAARAGAVRARRPRDDRPRRLVGAAVAQQPARRRPARPVPAQSQSRAVGRQPWRRG